MKSFLFVMAVLVVIFGVMLYFTPTSMCADVLYYADKNAIVNIYCRKVNCNAVNTGLGYQVTCPINDFNSVVADCGNIDGLSVSFKGSLQDVDVIFKRLQVTAVSYQQLDDLYVVCCYSSKLQGGVTVDGSRVNMQIAYSDGTVTVGYPLILGSY